MLPKEEIQKRVNILKRLKENLAQQREKFQKYLTVLDVEKESITEEKLDILKKQVAMEENLVSEIMTFQKVIDPLEDLWQKAYPAEKDPELSNLKMSLESLKTQVMEKNQENRLILSRRMEILDNEIKTIRPIRPRNAYSKAAPAPSLIDITT